MAEEKTKNEGEGSRTAAATYNEKTRRFVENEDVKAKAEEAADALDSHDGVVSLTPKLIRRIFKPRVAEIERMTAAGITIIQQSSNALNST